MQKKCFLQVKWPAEIKVDNAAGVTFQNKMSPASKLKGVFDLRQKWVQELQDRKQVNAVKVDTKLNLADILTKPLPAADRIRLLERLKLLASKI